MQTALAASRCCRPFAALRAAPSSKPAQVRCVAASHAVKPKHVTRRDVRAALFKFGNNVGSKTEEANAYGANQGRDDFTQTDLEDYFNYMGILAEEGNYDSLDKLVATGLHPIDCILVLACGQNDVPKVQEILRAGADMTVRDANGRLPRELVTKEELQQLLDDHAKRLVKA